MIPKQYSFHDWPYLVVSLHNVTYLHWILPYHYFFIFLCCWIKYLLLYFSRFFTRIFHLGPLSNRIINTFSFLERSAGIGVEWCCNLLLILSGGNMSFTMFSTNMRASPFIMLDSFFLLTSLPALFSPACLFAGSWFDISTSGSYISFRRFLFISFSCFHVTMVITLIITSL